MDTGYLKNVAIYIVSAILSLAVIAYIVYHLVGGFTAEIETVPAGIVNEREVVVLDGYIFRSEVLQYSTGGGEASCLFADGERVAVNEPICNLYSMGSSLETRDSIISIDNKLSVLKSSQISGNLAVSDTVSIDARINELYYSIRSRLAQGNVSYAVHKRNELLVMLNKRQIIVRTLSDFDDRISTLESRKSSLSQSINNITETVRANVCGYFSSDLDGYESIFDSALLPTLTLDGFEELKMTEAAAVSGAVNGRYAIGKVADEFAWYLVCEVTRADLRYYTEGSYRKIVFPYSGDCELSMYLDRIVSQTNDDRVLLIFKTMTIPQGFNFLRRQTVEVVRSEYTGYKVPISAVHMENGEAGVYILEKNTVRFRSIEPIYEKDGYFVSAEQDAAQDSEAYRRLGLYDLIITRGRDLYIGKKIG